MASSESRINQVAVSPRLQGQVLLVVSGRTAAGHSGGLRCRGAEGLGVIIEIGVGDGVDVAVGVRLTRRHESL